MAKWDNVYVVMNEGEPVFASEDKEEAEGYADEQGYKARQEALEEMGVDDPDEDDINEADFMAGFDGGCYEIFEVHLSKYKSGDTIDVGADEVDYDDIIDLLK